MKRLFFRDSAQMFVDTLKGMPTFVRHKANSHDMSALLREDQHSVWPLQP